MISGYRAIITGGGTGIGREAAVELSKRGCELILVGRRLEKLQETASECADNGAMVLPHVADIATEEGCKSAIQAAREFPGNVEPVLVNCAGMAAFGPLHEMSVDDVEGQLLVNLVGPIELCQAILPWMLEVGKGRIINIASMAATHVLPGSAVYSASKAGLVHFGKVLMAEYRKDGILVTTVIPGATDTSLWDEQSFSPDREDMIPASVIGQMIAQIVTAPRNMVVEEVTVMPVKGVL